MDVYGLSVPLWVLLSMLALLLYIIIMSRQFLTFQLQGIPGPFPLPVIGNLLLLSRLGTQEFDIRCIKKYGKIFGYYGGFTPLNLVVADKDILKQIFIKDFANFPNRVILKGLLGDVSEAIGALEGDHWKHVRNKITPTFSTGKLRKMIPLVHQASSTLIRNLKKKVENSDDGELDLHKFFSAFAMDVICSTAFGIQVDSQNNPNDEFVENANRFLNISFTSPLMLAVVFVPYANRIAEAFGFSVITPDVQRFFRKITTRLLDERKPGSKDRVDFLQLMKNAQTEQTDSDDECDKDVDDSDMTTTSSWSRKGITTKEIIANAEVFFLAGYETTSITLSLCVYNLALHPQYQDKIRQEIEAKVGSESLTYENIMKLQYLDMCLNETLRICPASVRTDRVCIRDTEVKGIKFKAGMNVMIPIYAIHHDPDYWEEPEKFLPERFSPERKADIDPVAFLPFGYGPRNCIGMRLALLETKMALANVFRHFTISVCSKTQIPPKLATVGLLKPESCWMKIEEIKRTK